MSDLQLGCIADDYTGASDLANTLTRAGLRTIQTIGIPSADLVLPQIDAVVLSLKSRSIAAAEAVALARAAQAWLRDRGARHVMFKVCSTFDSTDAGNIGPVTDALRAQAGMAGPALVTPAFPQTGRTVYQGSLFVGAVPLNESPLKDHPLNPMHDANLVRVLARQSADGVGLIPMAQVAAGADAIRARRADLAGQGLGAAIVDAVFDADLTPIGEAALDDAISIGASGLGLGLAKAMQARGWSNIHCSEQLLPVGGLAACVSGSCSQATLGQVAAAEAAGLPVLRLDPRALAMGPAEVRRALAWAAPLLANGPVLIASSAPPEAVRGLQTELGAAASSHAIEQGLAAIAQGLIDLGVRRLVLAGGETSGAAVDRLALPAFAVGPEIAPGVPVLRTIGQAGSPMMLVLKSGNFGGQDFFAQALERMA
ncbi:MAG: type effector Hrp-dependent outer [Caulobacteraceae bacterium]|nr:type effector Hrp-dependent outer [Caulobacteraceae bacterium]